MRGREGTGRGAETMKGGYWMIRTVRSGKVVEKSQFYRGERKPRAPKRKGSTTAARADRNMMTAARILARTINCNWGAKDLWVTLSYDEEHLPDDAAGADRACSLFWRRLGRELREQGVKLAGFWITADKDPETGETVRLHQHLLISGEGVRVAWAEDGSLAECSIGGRALADIWGQGGVHIELLREQEDYTPIAVYAVRQAAGGENAKKWHTSRGLKKPVVESERIVTYARELHTPPGATVSEIGHYDEASGTHYIRYIRRPRQKIGGHKEGAPEEAAP